MSYCPHLCAINKDTFAAAPCLSVLGLGWAGLSQWAHQREGREGGSKLPVRLAMVQEGSTGHGLPACLPRALPASTPLQLRMRLVLVAAQELSLSLCRTRIPLGCGVGKDALSQMWFLHPLEGFSGRVG